MHQIVATRAETSRRWWVLAIVVSAQFMFGVDAFIVNVAIPTIATELQATPAQIEAVIAIYLIAYGTLVVTGGRLGDIHGTRNVFVAGVAGFSVTSLWCGLAQSGPELIVARLAQGATAALMVPQVLATLHLLFPDAARARAFAIYGIVLGLAGAAGFMLGGALVTLDLAGLGWRAVFFVNVPFGVVIIAAALKIMPTVPRRAGTRLDIPGAIVLFVGLLCLIGPLLFGHDLGWTAWVWLVMAAGIAVIAAFVRIERSVARRGGMPLIDLSLLSDRTFTRGMVAVFFFFFANLSFYLVMTMFMQKGLQIPPLQAGLVFVPLALTFVIASRHSGMRARHRGTLVLIEGCALQIVGLGVLVATVQAIAAPSALLLALVLVIFGYGQGLVMAPLSSAVLSSVKPASAGAGSGMYGTTTQIGNAAGVAAIGAVFFAIEGATSAHLALFAACALFVLSISISAAFLSWMRRASA
ncbi:MFS transporter [Bradyrhizobium viridifuturi]|jgi:EmrB/QacA subfamily drug resistance transporter|uniref:MFS transporter n=1 Tax=Bradyrhizobium TaxID=374 RepID=UPI000396987B|nr:MULTISPECIES: MFS transporter [Bradyrhizobium]ERF82947.1 MAG: drug:H+ antiporter-2(DHA2) family drug resistance MFS transporter [Bradyrhizobium sp. DFCI-1]OYU63983.1 MAG: MFS transporter [Bradyrhizobium sp. PARBB1]PSO22415.1 MFS transporter [Bradyrhizobium sp. MOS004]QRI69975.1 MFS transporter [Bradyrhizobium sp. PSBB068]MBR1024627.1 MFS transporter [Bradyrhizobium viridifuturi]